jgi:hypothetical protein
MKFLLDSLQTLTNSQSCSESCIKFLFRLSFALIGQFFLVYGTFIAGFQDNFQNHRRVSEQKVGTSSLKRVTGRHFTLLRDFIEASRNFILDFLNKKTTEIVKTISAHSKGTVSNFRTFKKIFIS